MRSLCSLPLQTSVPLDASADAAYSSQVLNAVSAVIHERLSSHPINVARVLKNEPPANIVLLRGPGERINVPAFADVHGMKPFMIAPTCIIAGLGMSLGFDLVKAPGATGDYHSNLLAKADTALELLGHGDYDFGFVHVKAVDDAGHDRDVQKKVGSIDCGPLPHPSVSLSLKLPLTVWGVCSILRSTLSRKLMR